MISYFFRLVLQTESQTSQFYVKAKFSHGKKYRKENPRDGYELSLLRLHPITHSLFTPPLRKNGAISEMQKKR